MIKSYRSPLFYIPVFLALIIFIVAGIPIQIKKYSDLLLKWNILIAAGFYLAYSPIIYILIKLIRKKLKERIIIRGEGIKHITLKSETNILWNEITGISFSDIISPGQKKNKGKMIRVFKITSWKDEIRFYTMIPAAEQENPSNTEKQDILNKETYKFSTYGMYLKKSDSEEVVKYIRDYTGSDL